MTKRTCVPKPVGVYNPSTPTKSGPDYYTDSDDARELVSQRKAKFINRNADIRLERPPEDPPSNWESKKEWRIGQCGFSARVDEFVVGRYVEGRRQNTNRELVSAVEKAWGGR